MIINSEDNFKWSQFVKLAESAAQQSTGVRGKLSAVFWKDESFSNACPWPHNIDKIEQFGYNQIPNNPTEPLEYVEGFMECERYYPKTEDEAKTFSYDQLVSKPNVMHAEIDAMLKLLSYDRAGSDPYLNLYVTQSPCPNCARQIVKYTPELQTLYIQKLFRDVSGLEYLIENLESLSEIVIVNPNGTLTIFETSDNTCLPQIKRFIIDTME